MRQQDGGDGKAGRQRPTPECDLWAVPAPWHRHDRAGSGPLRQPAPLLSAVGVVLVLAPAPGVSRNSMIGRCGSGRAVGVPGKGPLLRSWCCPGGTDCGRWGRRGSSDCAVAVSGRYAIAQSRTGSGGETFATRYRAVGWWAAMSSRNAIAADALARRQASKVASKPRSGTSASMARAMGSSAARWRWIRPAGPRPGGAAALA